jgi:hypothetical protein
VITEYFPEEFWRFERLADEMKRDSYRLMLLSALLLSGAPQVSGQATTQLARPADGAATNAPVFQFGGGDFNQFMTKLRETFGKDVFELIEVRGEGANRLHVPKMRIRGLRDIRQVLLTYNRLSSEGDGFLGEWIFSPPLQPLPGSPPNEPDTIIFLPPKAGGSDGTAGILVRAFSILGITEEQQGALREVIERESRQLQHEIHSRGGDVSAADGRVNVHSGTGLLVASGGKTYVELVATVMEAFRDRRPNLAKPQ